MKIVIGCSEVCGLISLFTDQFRLIGHDVVSIAESEERYNKSYDISPSRFLPDYFKVRFNSVFMSNALNKIFWLLGSKKYDKAEKFFKKRLLKSCDIFIQIWNPLFEEEEMLKYLKKNDIKIITIFLGSEIRDYDVLAQQFDVSQWKFPKKYYLRTFEDKYKKLRLQEKFSDAIFSVPDQSGLAMKPYFHIQIPINLDEIKFKFNIRSKLKIMHAPTEPAIKGTDIIEECLDNLKTNGYEFEYIRIKGVSHQVLLEMLPDIDILVDEIVLHGPGVLSFEAMAAGCVVLTRYITDSPPCFRPPVIDIDANNLYDKISKIITDVNTRKELSYAGRAYVERNNTIEKVATDMLSKLNSTNYDYYPKFFREKFEPVSDSIEYINTMNELVKTETWYKNDVLPGIRGGLKF